MKKQEMIDMIGNSVNNEVLLRAIIEELYRRNRRKRFT